MGSSPPQLACLLSTLCLALGLLLEATSTQTNARHTRSDVRNMMDKLDPNFWPTRGRRSSTSSEETPPPFWANRGRAIEELGASMVECDVRDLSDNIMAHRGRDTPCSGKCFLKNLLSVEEPKWIMFNRRDAQGVGNDDAFWVPQGHPEIDDRSEQDQDQFWVSRGRKVRSDKKDISPSLYMPAEDFYPARGKRNVAPSKPMSFVYS